MLILNFFSRPGYTLTIVIPYFIHVDISQFSFWKIKIKWPDFFIDLDYNLILTIDFILYGFTWNDLLSKRTIGSKSSKDHDLLRVPSCISYISCEKQVKWGHNISCLNTRKQNHKNAAMSNPTTFLKLNNPCTWTLDYHIFRFVYIQLSYSIKFYGILFMIMKIIFTI